MTTTWVGGRVASPMFVDSEDGEGFQADLVIWLDVTHQQIVGLVPLPPSEDPAALAELLGKALGGPIKPPARAPDRICLATQELAAQVAVAARGIVVEVGPTPELDAFVEVMGANLPGANPVLAGFRRSFHDRREVVSALLSATARFFTSSPWNHLWDAEVLRLDVPALEASDWCVSVIGRARQSYGLVLFRSSVDYLQQLAFYDSMERSKGKARGARPAVEALSVTMAAEGELPGFVRRELIDLGWPLQRLAVYPVWFCSTPDGQARAVTGDELAVLLAATVAVTEHVAKYHEDFAGGPVPARTGEYPFALDGREVSARITSPHPGIPWDRLPPAPTKKRAKAARTKPEGGTGSSRRKSGK